MVEPKANAAKVHKNSYFQNQEGCGQVPDRWSWAMKNHNAPSKQHSHRAIPLPSLAISPYFLIQFLDILSLLENKQTKIS